MYMKALALILMIGFFAVYIGKMIAQRKKGIQTDQIAQGNKASTVLRAEPVMKIATYSVVCVEVVSIALGLTLLPLPVRVAGLLLCAAGGIIFPMSVYTMQNNWRGDFDQ